MNWWLFCYWYEADAPEDPVGLVRFWQMADSLSRDRVSVTVFPPRYRCATFPRGYCCRPIPLLHVPLLRPLSYAIGSFMIGMVKWLKQRPDVVYYRWMESPHVLWLAKLMRCRCICEVNGEPVPEWTGTAGIKRWLKEQLAQYTLQRCDGVVVLTDGLKHLVESRYHVRPERVIVLPSATDTHLFVQQDRDQCRQDNDLDRTAPYIGFVGTFYGYQGLSCLLTAFASIRDRLPSARLMLIGDGEQAAPLRQQACQLGIDQAVTLTGRVPYDRLPTLIGAMDVCVAPFRSDRGETSPVKIMDYLACARPVVASAIPSVSGVFGGQRGVMLVPPDDPGALAESLLGLLRDRERAIAIGQQGRAFIEQAHSWASVTTQLKRWIEAQQGQVPYAHSCVL